MSTLIVYASRYGATREVAEIVGDELRVHGPVDIRRADDVVDVSSYDAVVVGAGIYVGRLHPSVRAFLRRFRFELQDRPFAIFALGPVNDRDADWENASTALDQALYKNQLVADAKAVFGGAVDPPRMHFPFNRLPPADLRDWDSIRAWARELPAVLAREREFVADRH